jgi:phosphoserine phosphatase
MIPMTQPARVPGPLPSWNNRTAKEALIGFVELVTGDCPGGFVPGEERIAVFDNDGTLCSEMPVLMQFAFIADRVRALEPEYPEWKDKSPFKEILCGDMHGALSGGRGGISGVLAATYTGMTTVQFEHEVTRWMNTARHPVTGRLYSEMVYQPMLELLAYLRKNLFKIFIVSASGIDFMRPWTQGVYGIPPEQVIGSSIRLKYEVHDEVPVLIRLPNVEIFDEGEEKPVAIHHFIGRRPILAFGDSDGDLQMLQWVASGSGPRFTGLIHHTDTERECADKANNSDRPVGKPGRVLSEAYARGWTIVDMKRDWRTIFPFET